MESDSILCCTCLQPPTAEIEEYYTLDADPLSSNINLREQLLYCVPEYEEVLVGNGNLWMCSICCQGLCWGYIFRKQCLEIKEKLEMANNNANVKDEQVEVEETNFNEPPLHLVAGDDVKTEVLNDECRYSVVEITDPESFELPEPDVNSQLIEKACNTIPILKENNVTPNQFKCTVQVKLLSDNQMKQLQTCKNRSKPYSCDDCGKQFSNLFFLKCHKKWHNKRKNTASKRKTAANKIEAVPKAQNQNVDLLALKFQDLSLRKRRLLEADMPNLSPEWARHKKRIIGDESMPLLFPLTQPETNTNPHTTETLRTAIFNFNQNRPMVIDLYEDDHHENFGITVKPSFPTYNEITIPQNLRFVNEDALGENMNAYMSSLMKEIDPKTRNPAPAAVQSVVETEKKRGKRRLVADTDHTYSLSSKTSGGGCVECGWSTNNSELFDLHVDNYHAAWSLPEISHVEAESHDKDNSSEGFQKDNPKEHSLPELIVDLEKDATNAKIDVEFDHAPIIYFYALQDSQPQLQNSLLGHPVDESEGLIVAQYATENVTRVIPDTPRPSVCPNFHTEMSQIATQNTPNTFIRDIRNLNQHRIVFIPNNKPTIPLSIHATANIQQQHETSQEVTKTQENLSPSQQKNVPNALFVVRNPSAPNEVQFYAPNSVTIIPPLQRSNLPNLNNLAFVTAVTPQTSTTDENNVIQPTTSSEKCVSVKVPSLVVNAAEKKVLLPTTRPKVKVLNQVVIKKSVIGTQPLQLASVVNKTCERKFRATVSSGTENSEKDKVKEQTENFREETSAKVSDDNKRTNPLLSTTNPFASKIEVIYKEPDNDVIRTSENIVKAPLADSVNKQTNKVLLQSQYVNSLKRSADHHTNSKELNKKYKRDEELELPTLADEIVKTAKHGNDRMDNFEISKTQSTSKTSKQLKETIQKSSTKEKTKVEILKQQQIERHDSVFEKKTNPEFKFGVSAELVRNDALSEGKMADDTMFDTSCLESEDHTTEQHEEAVDNGFCQRLSAERMNQEENGSAVVADDQAPNKRRLKRKRNYLKKQMRNVIEKADRLIESKKQSAEALSENSDAPLIDLEKAISEVNFTIPKWVPSRGQRRCKSCMLFYNTNKRVLHLDNYHIDNKRETNTAAPSPQVFCNALIKSAEKEYSFIETTICPRCKTTFNVNYYERAHKHICGAPLPVNKEEQTEENRVELSDEDRKKPNKKPTKNKTPKKNRRGRSKSLSRLSTLHSKKLELSLEEGKMPKNLQEERHKDYMKRKYLKRDKTVEQKETPKMNTRGRSKSLSRLSTLRPKRDNSKHNLRLVEVPEKHKDCQKRKDQTDKKINAAPARIKKTENELTNQKQILNEERHVVGSTVSKDIADSTTHVLSKQVECDDAQSIETTCESDDLDSLVLRLEEDDFVPFVKKEVMDIPLTYDEDVIIIESDSTSASDLEDHEAVTPPEWENVSKQNRCYHCTFNLQRDNMKHFDNYHIENKRAQDTIRNTCPNYLNAITKLGKQIAVETTDCPQCEITFNKDYYEQAHKHICQKTIKNYKENKTIYTGQGCSENFNDVKALKLHCDEHKKGKPVQKMIREVQQKINETLEKLTDLKKYRCKKCEMCFHSSEVLKMHCVFKHGS